MLAIVSDLSAQAPVQNFSLTNVVDGSTVSLDNYLSVVVIFTSNTCPFDRYYRDRINALIRSHGLRTPFILINSCPQEDESPEMMKTAYAAWNQNVPYLADKEQVAMNLFAARKTPQVFVLNSKHVVVYSGAIDDNAQVANAVEESYLKDALDELSASQPVAIPATRPVGCSIRKK